MAVSCQLVLQQLREICPPRFALDRDPTGLQVGTADKQIDRVLCTLDLTLAVAEEARALGAGLVVSHHAVIYRPLENLRTDLERGRLLEALLKADIAVYVPHTALDVVTGGINDRLATTIGLIDCTVLKQTGSDQAMLCSFRVEGSGEEAVQLAHKAGAESVRWAGDLVEAIVPAGRAHRLAARLTEHLGDAGDEADLHRQQELEPRLIPLASHQRPRGIGRIGHLEAPLTVRDFARRVAEQLELPQVRVAAADLEAKVRKVAVLCGDGRSFVDAAIFAGCDAMVTGDIDHHSALAARARGIALLDVGHWGSERHAPMLIAAALRERLSDKKVEVLVSKVSTQPFELVPAPSAARG